MQMEPVYHTSDPSLLHVGKRCKEIMMDGTGVRLKSEGMHCIEVVPGLKFKTILGNPNISNLASVSTRCTLLGGGGSGVLEPFAGRARTLQPV